MADVSSFRDSEFKDFGLHFTLCTCTFHLSVNVFSTKVLIEDTIFYVS